MSYSQIESVRTGDGVDATTSTASPALITRNASTLTLTLLDINGSNSVQFSGADTVGPTMKAAFVAGLAERTAGGPARSWNLDGSATGADKDRLVWDPTADLFSVIDVAGTTTGVWTPDGLSGLVLGLADFGY